jgi:hypothetical protein
LNPGRPSRSLVAIKVYKFWNDEYIEKESVTDNLEHLPRGNVIKILIFGRGVTSRRSPAFIWIIFRCGECFTK